MVSYKTISNLLFPQRLQENPESYKDLTGSMVTILRQVVGGKLPLDFNYHSVPAPWLQIQLLRILAYLGKEDQGYSNISYHSRYVRPHPAPSHSGVT